MIVQVLGGSFGKLEEATFGTDEIIFPGKDGKHHKIIKVKEGVERAFFANERNLRRPDYSPKQLAADYAEARKKWPEHANMEIVVIFKDGRWAYVRAATVNKARIIKAQCPG